MVSFWTKRGPTWGMSVSQRIGYFTGPRLPSGCREWTSDVDRKGYAMLWAGRAERVVRLVLGLSRGDGLIARHRCDNPRCVEPTHLERGTVRDNVADMVGRDRIAKGERHGQARLTEARVLEIRRLHSEGLDCVEIHRQLGAAFGVSKSTIWEVASRRGWRHVS